MTSNYPPGVPSADGSEQFTENGLTDATEPAPAQPGYPAEPAGGIGSKKEVVGEQAASLAHGAQDAGAHVAQVAKDETRRVASEAGVQARGLLTNVGDELRTQAATQQARVAEGLRAVGSELTNMANGSATSSPGLATDVVNRVADQVNSVARWLDDRDPGSLLQEVKHFARSRPGLFIGVAAGAGVLAGRLTRALTAPTGDSGSAGSSATSTTPSAPAAGGFPTTTETAGVTGAGVTGTSGLGLGADDVTFGGGLR